MTYLDHMDPVLRAVLSDPSPTAPRVWHGTAGEHVVYHESGDYWTWTLPNGDAGRSDMYEVVWEALCAFRTRSTARKGKATK